MNPAFNGDHFVETELKRLVRKWSIATIIETGTYRGDSAKAMANLVPQILTIETDWQRFQEAGDLDKIPNIKRLHGDSPKMISQIAQYVVPPVLYYLDAHWSAHSPLLDELEAIAKAHLFPVIVIHDFLNPSHPEYAYDCWDIGPYELELVSPFLDRIYGAGKWLYHFNDESAAKPPRGVLYVEPSL